jgi:hypothetical protein
MKRCSTEIAARLALVAAFVAAPAGAEPPPDAGKWRGSGTPGLTLHFPSENFDQPDETGWFEQWEYMAHPKSDVPWFLDLLHADLGYARDDDTWLARIERWSPYDYGEHTLLDVDWEGIRVDGEAHRWRTGELRVTPVGTGDTGANVLPRLGSHYNDDTSPNDLFFVRRYGGGGEVRLRPDGFGQDWPLTQLSFYGSHETRTGQNQDTYLLDPDEVGRGPETARFRGRTRKIDEDVTTLGARLVANPADLATGVFDFSWQRFVENEPTYLVADLAEQDPADVRPTVGASQRALFFIPDTKRLSGSMLVSRRIGDATVHAGAFATRLTQNGTRAPLQRDADFEDNHVTTLSAHGAADVPITDWLGIDAYGKWVQRTNGMPRDTALFMDDNRTQLGPFLRELRDVRGGVELIGTPMPGARIATGFRLREVDRDLDYPLPEAADGIAQRAIYPAVSLVRDDSSNRSYYLRGHARLLRRTRVAAEVGYAWSPQLGMPTELEHAAYAEGRISHGLRAPVPITLAAFGHWMDGRSDGDFLLGSSFPDRSKDKNYANRTADWGASITALATRTTTVYASYVQQMDRQRFPHVRSNVPRPNGVDFVRFYLDSELGWDTDMRVFALGGTQQITRKIDFSLGGWLMLADGNFEGDSDTATALEDVDQIDLRQLSLEAALGVQVRSDLRLGLAYRFDRFRNESRVDEPDLDGHDHAITISATYDFEFARR